MKRNFKFYRLNYQIQAPTFRLIDDGGKQIGIVSKEEALKKARLEEKDLVEISASASPPVVKLIDFKKFKYLEAKKEKQNKKSKSGEVKEVRLTPFIGQHDFDTRLTKAREFISSGNQLKVVVKFSGREITRKEFGQKVITRFIEGTADIAKVIRPPFFEGRFLISMLVPLKKD
ncbi:translation initiation factor IF-3 [Candidatus Gottesmanbacteria bacterium]|nr:translation initiation factor IF-3 [Candidatus Gottesmanbacteria bacterium]